VRPPGALAVTVLPLKRAGGGSTERARLRGALGALVAALVLAAAAGCGSGSSTSSGTVSTPAGGPQSAATAAAGPGKGKPAVTLGTKNFTEQLILGELYAQALRARGFTVNVKRNVGPSEVIAREMQDGRIDGYPEYTGTILSVLAGDSRRPSSAAQAYARAAAYERSQGAALLAMAPAEDTNVLVTTPSYAAKHRLATISDLARLGSSATLAGPPEFRTRFDGLVGMSELYRVTDLRFRPVKIGTQYDTLRAGRADVVAVFTTDGELSQGGYSLLRDPKKIFGFQNVTFAVRQAALSREGPAFAKTIDMVSAKLSTQALRLMNAAVELDQQSPAPVARQFLAANGLI
jgi:osmoprotectant transport system substrate-binding protein